MTEEAIFRSITIILFLTIVAIGICHRLKAARPKEDTIAQRQEGILIMVLLRLFGFVTRIGLLLYMINPQLMQWSRLSLPSWLRWVGAGFGIVALPLIYWMFHSIGKNVTDTISIRKGHTLVTKGPYHWIRHPMYSFSFLALIGFSLLSANGFIALTGLLAFTAISCSHTP
ncbi:MAG: isoprenylcysteine carboxylmethyltransferase family protein [Segetibacter sp.]